MVLICCLNQVYSDHSWQPWKFTRAAKGFWKSDTGKREFVKFIVEEKGWKSKEDWYQITQEDFTAAGGEYMLRRFYNGNHIAALQQLYPDHKWELWKFGREHPSES